MNGIIKKMKWFIVAVLVVLVAGMTMFGVLGFNNTVDHANSYEVAVSVDQNVEKSKEILSTESAKYMAENGIGYTTQIFDDGAKIIYKVNGDVTDKVANLAATINAALSQNADTQGLVATVQVKSVIGNGSVQVGRLLLAIGVAILAVFLYVLIIERSLASACATICSAILSFLVFVSLMAITRVPALPFVEIVAAVSVALSAVLAVSTVNKYREELKNATTKVSFAQVAEKVAKTESKKYLLALISVLVSGVALAVFFAQYLLIIGAQMIFAGLAISVSYFFTPFVWTLIKNAKTK